MTPDPRAFVIVEQVAHGQWHCLTPDDAPAPVVNYASALSAGLLAASAGGWGLACANLEGTTVLVAFPDRVRRRALVIRQESRTEWAVVVRTFAVRSGKRPPFTPPSEDLRSYAGALAEAHRIFRQSGLPVLIEPKGEEARFLSPGEQRAFRNSYTPSRSSLGDILDGRPHHEY
ncbi:MULTISPECIES: hypothetical protein [unclassified Sphingomonas]|uniref:hypothetical protein n=1 Tax=unclassified Sphingomonas TaxID=196159 RepID=UPI0006F56066|nr:MULTISPECIES: hypothetical protein [unclassified Sphingomonas]KQM57145.1 hypothetical protein ASE65_12460 [Sphingomonas sp. Leaf16]KQN10320.1 hypothetical protein ASE81_12505 [Sphingomonas sp. Leaf29]KQN18121.1 hypothetical protein ASE83_12435 [Sphingomonas sp. Leaf32]